MGDVLVRATDVTHSFGSRLALDRVDLTLRAGEVVALLGKNGAGKTTLMRLIVQLIGVQQGTLEVSGGVGYCPQDLQVWPDLTVAEQLHFMARMQEVSADNVVTMLAELELGERADSLASELSGGLRRRLSIALATIHRPSVLVLDEPEVGLDASSRIAMRKYLRREAESGRCVLLSTHSLDEVERVADRVVLLDRGRVVGDGTPAEIAGDGTLEDRFLS